MAQVSAASPELAHQTRQRLLEVAGEVFAEYGYRAATIREICRRAGANVAAVNYHFRDKDGLYAKCLTYWLAEAMKKYPPDMGVTPDSAPELRLRAFVRSFVFRILDESRHAWYGKLIARNLVETTPFLDTCVEQSVRPMSQRLYGMIREIVGPQANERAVELAGLSIIGQIMFHRHSRSAITRLFPHMGCTHEDLERLADHITKFSLAGLRELTKQE
jgi:TetR/AcrR family transcriptional regulator, regulator of cefoperazone and chloramphenicol sensitivity